MPETTPPEPAEDLGNTIDGTGAGDGSTTRTDSDDDSPGSARQVPSSGSTGPGTATGPQDAQHHSDSREEQKQVYQTPEQPDHALGGSDGTADGS